MSALTEFLKEQKDKQARSAAQVQAKREEWVAALDRLIDQLKTWLKEADPEGVLGVGCGATHINEEVYGRYKVPELMIVLQGRTVTVVPRGLNVMTYLDTEISKGRVQGRVDIVGPDQQYIMYRFVGPEGERWFIVDGHERNVRPLDREAFESTLLSLLQ
jgi:hypothetical protein